MISWDLGRTNIATCIVHSSYTDILDLVYEVATLVTNDLPHGVMQFGLHLGKYMEKKAALPELPENLASEISVKHIELIKSMRSNYLSRVLVRAIGDRKLAQGLCEGKDKDEFTATRVKSLIAKNCKKILEVDTMLGTPDQHIVISTWNAIMSDILKTGTFHPGDVVVSSESTSATQQRHAKDEGGDSAFTSSSRTVSLCEIFMFGHINQPNNDEKDSDENQMIDNTADPSQKPDNPDKHDDENKSDKDKEKEKEEGKDIEKNACELTKELEKLHKTHQPALHFDSIDKLFLIRLAIQTDLVKHFRSEKNTKSIVSIKPHYIYISCVKKTKQQKHTHIYIYTNKDMIIIMVMVRIGLQHSALAPIMAPATSPLRRSPAQRPRFSRSTESPLPFPRHEQVSSTVP